MNEHTKLPLFISQGGQEIIDAEGENYAYMSHKLCNCRCSPKPVLYWDSRAHHIINCINNFDELVAACKDLASLKGKIPNFIGSTFLEIARDSAIAALAKIEPIDPKDVEINRLKRIIVELQQ